MGVARLHLAAGLIASPGATLAGDIIYATVHSSNQSVTWPMKKTPLSKITTCDNPKIHDGEYTILGKPSGLWVEHDQAGVVKGTSGTIVDATGFISVKWPDSEYMASQLDRQQDYLFTGDMGYDERSYYFKSPDVEKVYEIDSVKGFVFSKALTDEDKIMVALKNAEMNKPEPQSTSSFVWKVALGVIVGIIALYVAVNLIQLTAKCVSTETVQDCGTPDPNSGN